MRSVRRRGREAHARYCTREDCKRVIPDVPTIGVPYLSWGSANQYSSHDMYVSRDVKAVLVLVSMVCASLHLLRMLRVSQLLSSAFSLIDMRSHFLKLTSTYLPDSISYWSTGVRWDRCLHLLRGTSMLRSNPCEAPHGVCTTRSPLPYLHRRAKPCSPWDRTIGDGTST